MSMYNLKNILFGVGIGMILTSALNISFGDKELTLQDIKNEAQKHNLIVIDGNELIEKKDDSNNEGSTLPKDNSGAVDKIDVFVEINIEKGLNSGQVAKLLKDKELINDELTFINELNRQNKSNIIQYGKYSIKKGIETQELIKIITTVR